MFTPTSRYAKLPTTSITLPDGRQAVYVRRRFLPKPGKMVLLETTTVNAGERLDHVAYRALGDPELYWRLCDANEAMHPGDLPLSPGRRLHVPEPEA